MFKKFFIIVPILFSLQTFAESGDYVSMFKVSKATVKTKTQLQEDLVRDLNSLKTIFDEDESLALKADTPEEEEIFEIISAL